MKYLGYSPRQKVDVLAANNIGEEGTDEFGVVIAAVLIDLCPRSATGRCGQINGRSAALRDCPFVADHCLMLLAYIP
jgi:hypothetical protein